MTEFLSEKFVGYLLNKLEDLELPLLSWGITDGALSETEALEVILDCLASHPDAPQNIAPEAVLDKLRDLAVLFQLPAQSPRRFRTRLAETLRLTAQLRQLFPWHIRDDSDGPASNWWLQGARLVADYRLHTAGRRYPERNVEAPDALAMFRQAPGWGTIHEHIAAAQIGSRRLAQFQVSATQAVFGCLARPQSAGVIVGAGTGSGKTLAFYLPALADMAEQAHPRAARIHTLALYPRKELLRDQLREALANTLAIEPVLRQHNRRPLRIGALYADTPPTPESLDRPGNRYGDRGSSRWQRASDGFICPLLTCPWCSVGDLLWSDSDRHAGTERLRCLGCREVVPHGRIALTRRSIQKDRPDLLFTTTETLNRRSTDPWLGRLLGWSGQDGPSLVLLDEVHTYTGSHGAQVALLLRRWRHALRKRVTFVGLSATLKDAGQFFAQLTGLSSSAVEHIDPSRDDMEVEGREYAIALRGDPVSGASLLSTSIQVAMLFGRTLDPKAQSFIYGSTGFLFTDDLDVTNRFYDNLRDAEGGQTRSGYQRRRGQVLAGLRSPELAQYGARFGDGQSWDLVEKIGHRLDPGLRTGSLQIGRTSSQDAGVDLDAHLTVATASLEVGFNDPRVGLILQHKSPHNAAAFIQRRGRAGRTRDTRPLTVVTLSDFGRDRLTYQGYETLFVPELTPQNLSIHNRYVLKIQASFALLDWLSRDLQRAHRGEDPRNLLTAPRGRPDPEKAAAREWLIARLETTLTDGDVQDRLARHLQVALQISADEAQALLCEPPRSLLFAVIPTALRRLHSEWEPLRHDPGATPGTMLPEFVTRALFEPLNLPEVEFDLPFETGNNEERLPIARALREAVPGRVSRRYGYRRDEHRTWIPVPENGNEIELTETMILSEANPEGIWRPSGPEYDDVMVVRPYRMRLQQPLPELADRSNATPLWGTEIVVPEDAPPNDEDVTGHATWQRHLRIGFSTHATGNPIEVRRMTYGADCDLAYQRSSERRSIRYTYEGRPAALGFRLAVDAVRVELSPVDIANARVREYMSSPQWRSQAFFRAVAEDPALIEITNTFKRDWLALIYFTAFSLAGLEDDRTPDQIRTALADGSWRSDLAKILEVLYRQDESSANQNTARLVAELTELSRDADVVAALDRAGRLLTTQDVAARTEEWARRAYRDTFAAAVLAAVLRSCPDAQESDLIVDIVPGTTHGSPDTIWLTETSVGGLGVIEHLVRAYASAPQRFWTLVAGALKPNEYEYIDATVTRLLRQIVREDPGGPAAAAMAAMRSSGSAAESDRALRDLRAAWAELDGPPRHGAVATVSARLLRPGSSPDTDETSLRILDEWTALEERLGVEVDARVIAYAIGSGDLTVSHHPLKADQAFSMMWPRGARARSNHLQHYQPYAHPDRPALVDRLLVEAAHDERLPRIEVTEPGWQQRYQTVMADIGAADLFCAANDRSSLSQAMAQIPALPVDRDVLRVYGELEYVTRYGNEAIMRVVLREAEL